MHDQTMRRTQATNAGRAELTEHDRMMLALRAIADAIVEGVKAAGELGAPSGHIYAALMSYGLSLDQYYSFVRVLVGAGKIRQAGNLLFAI